MIDGLMETLCTEPTERTGQECDDDLGKSVLPIEMTLCAADALNPPPSKKKKNPRTKKAIPPIEQGKKYILCGKEVTRIDITNLTRTTTIRAVKMDEIKDGETIYIDHVVPINGQYGLNYIMYVNDGKRAFWSNKAATSIICNCIVNFGKQYLVIVKNGDKDFEYSYTNKETELKIIDTKTNEKESIFI